MAIKIINFVYLNNGKSEFPVLKDINKNLNNTKKALLAGWFSFSDGHATAGDLLALDVTCVWLKKAGYSYDIAYESPFEGGINWKVADPGKYSHVIFVCGPFQQGDNEADFISRFNNCRIIGLNLTMILPIEKWNPFDLLLERDSNSKVRPDMVFLSNEKHVPIVGICLVEPYDGALDYMANKAIQRLVNANKMGIVNIDTRLDLNATHLRTPAEVESLIAKMDVIITTRLHGAVLAIKNGIPVLPIDPEAGGAKIVKQMRKIGWPIIFTADALSEDELQNGYEYCLTEEAKKKAVDCFRYAKKTIEKTSEEFIKEMIEHTVLERNYISRLAHPQSQNWFLENIECRKAIELQAMQELQKYEVEQKLTLKLKNKMKGIVRIIAYYSLPTPLFNLIKKYM